MFDNQHPVIPMANHKPVIKEVIYNKKGRILSEAENSYTKTHPYQKRLAEKSKNPHRIYLHAEIAALVRCRGVPYKISITRINAHGELVLAKPCDICELAIKEAGIKIVEFSI